LQVPSRADEIEQLRSLYDPTAGTGGMLRVAGEYLTEHNPDSRLVMYGQELNSATIFLRFSSSAVTALAGAN
jgi:type I restriction-modification system DNA methylase subunit